MGDEMGYIYIYPYWVLGDSPGDLLRKNHEIIIFCLLLLIRRMNDAFDIEVHNGGSKGGGGTESDIFI